MSAGSKTGKNFDRGFWDAHYVEQRVPWDMGHVSPPLKAYIDQLPDKSIEILIPGAGNAWEAEYLWNNGFRHIDVVDLSSLPLENLKARVADFPEQRLLHLDFFSITKKYDLILEQTFFCALHPRQREAYARHMHKILKHGGKLAGLLFSFPLEEGQEKPPFGGSGAEYLGYFEPLFHIRVFEEAHNSHPARLGREYFMLLEKE